MPSLNKAGLNKVGLEKLPKIFFLLIVVVVILLDQATKYWMVKYLTFHMPVEITSWFNLFLDFNRGAAFSLFHQASGWQVIFFSALGILVSAIICFWVWRDHNATLLKLFALALIMGGALGNVMDRVRLHYVIDFISLHIHQYYWPTFNIADSAVCLGVVLFLWSSRHDKKS